MENQRHYLNHTNQVVAVGLTDKRIDLVHSEQENLIRTFTSKKSYQRKSYTNFRQLKISRTKLKEILSNYGI
jgi:hypothetical protein